MKRRLFVLGAGFSVAQGLPTVRNLQPELDRFLDSDEDALMRLLTRQYKEEVTAHPCDLGFEPMLAEMKRRHPEGHAAIECIQRGVARMFYRRVPKTRAVEECYLNFADWLAYDPTRRRHAGKVISFNWDLVLEKALLSRKISWLYYDHPGKVGFIKPHGSLNWNAYRHQNLVSRAEGYKPIQPDSRIVCNSENILEDQFSQNIHQSEMRFMLFPGDKERPRGDRDQELLWTEAEKALRESDAVIFIGYSLPAYDVLARKLLIDNIRSRTELELYSRNDGTIQNYVECFGNRIDIRPEHFEESKYARPPEEDE